MSEILSLIKQLKEASTNYGINKFTNPILASRYYYEIYELEQQLNDAIEVYGCERYDAGQLDNSYYSTFGDH